MACDFTRGWRVRRVLTVDHDVWVALRIGGHKGEQFTPELFWQCRVIASDSDRCARGGRGDPCTQCPCHSIQAQNAANGILLSDCGKINLFEKMCCVGRRDGGRKSIASRRSFAALRTTKRGSAGRGTGWRGNRGNLTPNPFPWWKGNKSVGASVDRVDTVLDSRNPHQRLRAGSLP